MNDVLTQVIKDKILRVIRFCEEEDIDMFTFSESIGMADFSLRFDLDFIDDDGWSLELTIQNHDFMLDDEEMRDDIEFVYKIEGEEFILEDEDDNGYEETEEYEILSF